MTLSSSPGESKVQTAGRELDVLVAEKVMGWAWVELTVIPEGEWDFQVFRPWSASDLDNPTWRLAQRDGARSGSALLSVPRYSTKIADAWLVVEKMRERTPGGDIHIESLDGEWSVSCCFDKSEGGWTLWRSSVSAPHAISLAALDAFSAPSSSVPSTGGEL